jgi:hypothetical protein
MIDDANAINLAQAGLVGGAILGDLLSDGAGAAATPAEMAAYNAMSLTATAYRNVGEALRSDSNGLQKGFATDKAISALSGKIEPKTAKQIFEMLSGQIAGAADSNGGC